MDPDLLSRPASQVSLENRPQIQGGLAAEHYYPERPKTDKSERFTALLKRHSHIGAFFRIRDYNPFATRKYYESTSFKHSESTTLKHGEVPALEHSQPVLLTSLVDDLCSRCEALKFKIISEERCSFQVVARLEDANQLLNSPECALCRLLDKIRPLSSNCDAQGCSD